MIVITVTDDGVIVDEIQIEPMPTDLSRNFYEWRSTKLPGASGTVRHRHDDGLMVLARLVLERRSIWPR